ncbi:hypothetical protein [Candidatus Manganitrophus noduliformans]|uniref:Uncharacterized protein n=1 Tax=Candidatus Manganitrophus noduliformans TaxID=2606439 RepID=A0A7X6DU99_9BACT|nr:hypothetical protein [Candidatus Manganitrophus noduliformans]NKE73535.1 hypothetical protein [Candidatus Manganitrophus noduliformans]
MTLRAVHESKSFVDVQNEATSLGWTTLDVKVNQEVGKHTTLFAGIDNVTDLHRTRTGPISATSGR